MVERLGLHQASIGPMIMMPAIDHLLEAPRAPTTQSRDLQRDSQQLVLLAQPFPMRIGDDV